MKKIKNKKIILPVSFLVLLASGGAIYSLVSPSLNQPANMPGAEVSENENQSNKFKTTLPSAKKDDGNRSQASNNKSGEVTPQITSAGQYDNFVEVGARVPGVFEESGSCTLTLYKDGKAVSVSKKSSQNVSEMSCGFMKISRTKLSAGNWSAVVSYSSKKYSGKSEPLPIEVR